MRNVFKIFRKDFRALYRNGLAFLIILAVCVLPALYAWFNIYAFGDPYSNTDNIEIAVVNGDTDYVDSDGNVVNLGKDLVSELEGSEDFGYVFLDDPDAAINGVYDGTYYAAVVIESDFTYNMYNFLTADMDHPTITFYQNEKRNAIAVKIVEASADEIKHSVNAKYIDTMVETLFGKLNNFSSDVQGETSADMVKNTLIKINNNLASYNSTISAFVSASNAMIDTLNDTGNTLNYSIYLIGNERVNISSQISYIEGTQKDLALINDEVSKMLLSIQDSVAEAIYKLDRLYQGNTDDQEAALQALAELERQYQELVDYLKNSGLTGTDVDDAMSALNTLAEKISELRTKLGLNSDSSTAESSNAQVRALAKHNQALIESVETDFETVAVPAVYKAVTGYDYEDLSNPSSSTQSLESMFEFMVEDSQDRITDIQSNLKTAKTARTVTAREEALTSAQADMQILTRELDALGTASQAIETVSSSKLGTAAGTTGLFDSIGKASDSADDANSILDDILSGKRDIDLVNDLQLVSDALGTVRVTMTEVVYPMLDTMLENLQDTMGDISSLLLDLNDILGKATPIIDQLSNTFGLVNNALVKVQGLINSYCERITDLIDVLDGGENEWLDSVLEFFDIDPESIGKFLANPVSIETEAVYPVKNYGSAMAPFYTMLAIWVGCVIINSILKSERPVECEDATDTEKFFGRYMIFFLISQIQTLIIMLGDLYIFNIQCLHPALFLIAGIVTSLVCSLLAYSFTMAFGNMGKFLIVVIMIIQIAGSGGSYPIELLPDFFQQVYLFFPFPYAIGAMRECIAGIYQSDYLVFLLKLLIFLGIGLLIGLVLRPSLKGVNRYMDEQLEDTEMM